MIYLHTYVWWQTSSKAQNLNFLFISSVYLLRTCKHSGPLDYIMNEQHTAAFLLDNPFVHTSECTCIAAMQHTNYFLSRNQNWKCLMYVIYTCTVQTRKKAKLVFPEF